MHFKAASFGRRFFICSADYTAHAASGKRGSRLEEPLMRLGERGFRAANRFAIGEIWVEWSDDSAEIQ